LNTEAATPVDPTLAIIHFAAFAEEMNKSRLMLSRLSRKLAAKGISTLQIDHFGTGDSEGDLSDANWDLWLNDVGIAVEWLQSRGINRVSIWANRLGGALAIDFVGQKSIAIDKFVWWQPVTNGALYLKQMMRMRKAAEMIHSTADSNEQNLQGGPEDGTEVAGYFLSNDLQESISKVKLEDLSLECEHAAIFEVSALAPPDLVMPSKQLAAAWHEQGVEVATQAFAGEPYWSTTEIVCNDHLLNATEAYFANE
jgi:exosortase A-associated hydrolase 2